MLTVCCVCHRIKEKGYWFGNYRKTTGEPVSHGYCPDCYQQAMKELSKMNVVHSRQEFFSCPISRSRTKKTLDRSFY